MSLSLHNGHPTKTLRTATFRCRVEINNAIELFNGYAYASPSILPRGGSSVDLEFQGRQKLTIGLYSLPHPEQFERVQTISTRNHLVNSLQYSCTPISALFF